VTITTALEMMEQYFVSEYDIQKYKERFFAIKQRYNESPKAFLGRVRDAAYEANIRGEDRIQSQFKTGLLPAIQKHCTRMCAVTHENILRMAEGYWDAER
ncbi:hypothetical protein BDA99DRAFT_416837, partial [Phascolomyces articulosus]